MAVLNYVIECWVQQMFNINFTTFEEFFLRKKRVESCESAKTENLCKTTSIHAKQPQFVQRKKTQKVTAYFRRLKRIFEPEIFSLARGYI